MRTQNALSGTPVDNRANVDVTFFVRNESYSKIPQVWYILNETFCIKIISEKYDSFIYPDLGKWKNKNPTA